MESSHVQVATEVPLSKVQRSQLQEQAARFLAKHEARFGFSEMHLHLKNDGPQLACQLHLVTDGGRYNTTANGWDARSVMQQAVNALDQQVTKHFEKMAHEL